jgi:hypothetical protein
MAPEISYHEEADEDFIRDHDLELRRWMNEEFSNVVPNAEIYDDALVL